MEDTMPSRKTELVTVGILVTSGAFAMLAGRAHNPMPPQIDTFT
jgi:hypothetical protein